MANTNRSVTIKDVARASNLSIATVSRAFHNPSLLSAETRAAVERAVAALHYRPSVTAQRMRGTRTQLVLVVVPSLSPFFLQVFAGAEAAAVSAGYGVLVGHTDRDPARERGLVEHVAAGRADGLMLVTSVVDYDAVDLRRMPPTVLALDIGKRSHLPTVRIDHIAGARRMTDYLLDLGHLRIAHVLGAEQSAMSRHRLEGYRQALNGRGVPIDSSLCPKGDFTTASGDAAAAALVALPDPPTAIFAANDQMALGVIRTLRAAGLRVPEDVSVVGFDDERLAALSTPPLSTVRIDTYNLGLRAMQELLRVIDGESTGIEVVMDTELVIRRSARAFSVPV